MLRLLPIFLGSGTHRALPAARRRRQARRTRSTRSSSSSATARIREVVRGHVRRKLLRRPPQPRARHESRRGGRPARAVLARVPARLPPQPALLRRLRRPPRTAAGRRARRSTSGPPRARPRPRDDPASRRPAPVRPRRAAVREHRHGATTRRSARIRRRSRASSCASTRACNPPGPRSSPLGLRNPWRFSIDRLMGHRADRRGRRELVRRRSTCFAADAAPGTNFGWPADEGNDLVAGHAPFDARAPALTYRHGRRPGAP